MNYEEVKNETLRLLYKNDEWIKRYNGYMEKLNKMTHINIREKIHLPSTLKLYTSLSNYIKNEFDLRYKGHSIASLVISKNGKVVIKLKAQNSCTSILFNGLEELPNEFEWSSKYATKFRKHFEQDILIETEREHQVESSMITALTKTSGKMNFRYIEPITLNNYRYQFPTPLKASKLKDDIIEYKASLGGGIDILARAGLGKNNKITVIELKDKQNKTELVKEAPDIAIKQAIAYATFIHELLRNSNVDNEAWYHLFGYSGKIPSKLIINAVIALPKSSNNTDKFAKQKLKFENSSDYIELHYIYYDYNDIKNDIKTSL